MQSHQPRLTWRTPSRSDLLQKLSTQRPPVYDLIVIGGGVNGTAIARDAALRGLQVLLLEKNDFGAGTSALSSRLIHGGLRYLAHLEWGLVRESLQERDRLLKNAPHLVRPLPLAIPFYRDSRNPAWLIRLGLLFYDSINRSHMLPRHCVYGKTEFLRHYPSLNAEGLEGGAVYYDAQVAFPERLCVENAISALETGHADLLNHTEVTGWERTSAPLHLLVFEDRLAEDSETRQTYQALGKVVVNAAGPWVDRVLHIPEKSPARRIGGTRGSHIVVDRFPGGPDTALYTEADDGRPFFIIPWLERYYLIGTTDLRCDEDPDTLAAQPDEAAYLLQATNHVLPQAKLTMADIRYSYCGMRPLPCATARNAGKITRRHHIEHHSLQPGNPLFGWISIIGGKLTTARNLAEEAVDATISLYGLRLPDGRPVPRSRTDRTPLPGAEGLGDLAQYQPTEIAATYGISPTLAQALTDRYGIRYSQVLAYAKENPQWLQPLYETSTNIGAEVIYAMRAELACTLEDISLRRLGCGLEDDMGFRAAQTVARLMSDEAGWPPNKMEAELQAYRNKMLELRQSHIKT